jgi:hypothetical protein
MGTSRVILIGKGAPTVFEGLDLVKKYFWHLWD